MCNRNILITGVKGYIGSKIALDMLSKGYSVMGVDLLCENKEILSDNINFKFYISDITNITTFPIEIKDANILIHCAALVHKRSKNLSRENYFRINYEGTKNILNFLDKDKLKQIIFLSTVSVYGEINNNNIIPDELTKTTPKDFYGESKLASENVIKEFSLKHKIPYTIFRLTPVYGDFFLLNIYRRIYLPGKIAFYKTGSGEQHLSICSVYNVVDVISESINNNLFYNQTFIIKDSTDYTINELILFFKLKKNKPVITIPTNAVMAVFKILNFFMPKKANYLIYNFKKISQNSIYSAEKLFSTGFFPKWNLYNTFSKK